MIMMHDQRIKHSPCDPNLGHVGTAENKQLIRDAEQCLANRDREGWLSFLDDNIRCNVMGTTTWSRTYQGKATIRSELFAPLTAQYAEPYQRNLLQLIGDGDWIVARCQGHVSLNTGDLYDNQYCFLYRIHNGHIHEIIEYGDTALIERVLKPRV